MIEEEIRITGNTSQAQKSFDDLGKVIAEQKQITIDFQKELVVLESKLVATGNADWNPQGDFLKKKIIGIKDAIRDQKVALTDLNNQRTQAKKSQTNYTRGLTRTSGVVKVLNKLTGGLAGELLMVGKAATRGGKAMRVALISSGIGAAVALVGFLVSHWEDIGSFLGFINKDLEEQVRLNERNVKITGEQLSKIDLQIKLGKKKGENVDDLIKKRKELLEIQKAQLILQRADLEIQHEILVNEAKKVGFFERFSNDFLDKTEGLNKKTAEMMGEITESEQTMIDESKTRLDDIDKLLLRIDIKETPDKAKENDEKIKDQDKFLGDLDRLQKQALEENLSKEEKEIQAVKDKYDETIRAAKLAKIDTGIIEEGRREAMEAIDTKYRGIELVEFEKQQQKKQEILDRVGVEGLEAKIKAIEDKAEEDVKELGDLEIHREAIEAIYQASEDKITEIVTGASNEVLKEGETAKATEIKTAEEVASAKDAVINNSVDNVAKGFRALAALDEENKALQAASLIAGNLIGAAKTIQNTIVANAAATAAFPLSAGQPFVAINTVAATLGIAASAAATAKGLASLGKGGSTGGTTGLDGGGGGASAPEFNLVEGSESNAIQESITGQDNAIKAVVISGDVTTAQQIDRNIVEGSGI